VWDKLKRQLNTERAQLNLLFQTHRAILSKCCRVEPGVDEIPALAAILHAFYSGVENLFKRIAVAMDGGTPEGEFWHSELLDAMAVARHNRPGAISPDLCETSQDYLDFRHRFRHAYTFELKWSRMASLVFAAEGTLKQLDAELDLFLSAIEPKPETKGTYLER
jgi:hypothetical protein